MKDLNIRVAFSGIDKLTRPVNAARNSVGGLSESLKKTQSSIKDLDTQSQAFTRLNERVKKTSQQLATTQRAFDGLNKAQKDGATLTDAQRERMTALAAKIDRLSASRSKRRQNFSRQHRHYARMAFHLRVGIALSRAQLGALSSITRR